MAYHFTNLEKSRVEDKLKGPHVGIKYHPERYYRTRTFVKTLLPIYRQKVDGVMPSVDAVNLIGQAFMPFYDAAILESPLEQRPTDARQMQEEISLFMHYAAFHASGRNIFHFQPALTDLLRRTDVDDVILDNIHIPYDAFYLGFSQQADLDLWGQGYLVDGAYVSRIKVDTTDLIQILLTTIRTDLDYSEKPNFVLYPDRYYYFPLHVTKPGMTVGAAVKKSIAEHGLFEPKEILDTSGEYSVLERTVSVADRGKLSQIEVAENNQKGFPIFHESLKLIVNGLCYLSSQHREVDTRFPDHTPQNLLEKLARATNIRDASRTTSKLASMGYTKIHFCGDTIQRAYDALPNGRELSSHWRRGHWRNQSYGEQYSEHKLLWIRPTLVRKDKGEPPSGHIYSVGEKSLKEHNPDTQV